jgi:hypothetical protein
LICPMVTASYPRRRSSFYFFEMPSSALAN